MPKGKNQHVVKHPRGWAMKGEGTRNQTQKSTEGMEKSEPETAMEMIHVLQETGNNTTMNTYKETTYA